MREIKFRIPVVCQNGHRGYWHYRIDSGSDFAKTTDSQPPKNVCKCPKTGIGEGWSRAGVDEQYTGLKDKNGKEIYEGDVCAVNGGAEDMHGPVGFENGCFIWKAPWIKPEQTYPELKYYCGFKEEFISIEVIGTIYENPELLEG